MYLSEVPTSRRAVAWPSSLSTESLGTAWRDHPVAVRKSLFGGRLSKTLLFYLSMYRPGWTLARERCSSLRSERQPP